ncbi:MAG TPA: carboxypeptidase regulatory-like domain-containing protein [Bryobacteraceae bacterium]
MYSLLLRLCIALGCCVVASAQAQSASPPSGAIGGMVVDRSDNAPIRRAIVTLSTVEAHPQDAVAWTDDDGRFGFAYLPPGQYELRVTKNRYQEAAYGTDAPSRPPAVIALGAGEIRSDFVFRLQRTISLTGSVLDENGLPLAEVQVWTMQWRWRRQKRTLIRGAGAVSDSTGRYRITGLRPGSYIFAAIPQPGRAVVKAATEVVAGEIQPQYSLGVQFYPGSDRAEAATPVTVEPGHEYSQIDFHFAAQRNPSLKGRLLLASGVTATEQISVRVNRKDRLSDEIPAFARVSQPDLAFTLNSLPPGSYLFLAEASVAGKRYRGVREVEVGSEDLTDLNISLEPPVDLSGTVTVEGPGTAKFRPSSVTLVPGDAIPWDSGSLRSAINPDGTFKIAGVPPGVWDINPGRLPSDGYLKSMRLGDQDVLTEEMVIQPSTEASLKIVIGTQAAIVQGDVTADAHPVRAVVLLAPEPRFQHVLAFYRVVASDGNGHFVMKNVTPGNYRLYAFAGFDRNLIEDPDFRNLLASGGLSVALREGDNPPVNISVLSAADPLSRAASGEIP